MQSAPAQGTRRIFQSGEIPDKARDIARRENINQPARVIQPDLNNTKVYDAVEDIFIKDDRSGVGNGACAPFPTLRSSIQSLNLAAFLASVQQ
jgi:hypothetical protein